MKELDEKISLRVNTSVPVQADNEGNSKEVEQFTPPPPEALRNDLNDVNDVIDAFDPDSSN
jgi:hypothetical protein